jgi:hypothetical protein
VANAWCPCAASAANAKASPVAATVIDLSRIDPPCVDVWRILAAPAPGVEFVQRESTVLQPGPAA